MFLMEGVQSAESLHLLWQVGMDGCKFSYEQHAFKARLPRLWLTAEFQDMRHLFPVVMAFQVFWKDLTNRRVRVGLESKRLVECVNNETSKDTGLMALIRPLVLLLLLNNIQLCAHLYESKCSEESSGYLKCPSEKHYGNSLTFINKCHLVLINKTLMLYVCSDAV